MTQKVSNSKRVFELLDKRYILTNLQEKPKEELIKEMISFLPHTEIADISSEEIVQAILKRESLESTGIGNGIAIPHTRLSSIKNFYIILGLSKKGVDFEAIDRKPVHIIFLVLAREDDKTLYIRILARLARLLHNEEFRNSLLEQNSPEDVIHFIKRFESF
jgi:PTS system nitrogen regulatory IIA component